MKRSILIVDDDSHVRASLSEVLADEGLDVATAADAEQALERIAADEPDLVLSDVRMPGTDGIELLRRIRSVAPSVTVVLMTAYDDLPTVATAMREGAAEFLVKPLDLHVLRRVIGRVFDDRTALAQSQTARRKSSIGAKGGRQAPIVIGHDPKMIEIFKLIGQVAASRTSVIIRGESGTGKELVARAIHESSPYASEPFVPVNCTALPGDLLESELFGHVRGSFTGATADRQGRFAAAAKGTIFLDEIGDTPLSLQAKLLRVLQEHEYYPVGSDRAERMQARVLSATHRDLEAMVESGNFRQDLYYRLRVLEIVVPPLRERPDDIETLAVYLLARAFQSSKRPVPVLSHDALLELRKHAWPGNVRELENALIRAALLGQREVLRAEDLSLVTRAAEEPGTDQGRLTSLADIEREHVSKVLQATGHHKARAAEILGVSRPRLDRLIRKYDIGRTGPDRPDEA